MAYETIETEDEYNELVSIQQQRIARLAKLEVIAEAAREIVNARNRITDVWPTTGHEINTSRDFDKKFLALENALDALEDQGDD